MTEAKGAGKNKNAFKKTANAVDTTVVLSEEPGLEEVHDSAQEQKHNKGDDNEPSQCTTVSQKLLQATCRVSHHTVHRSLMGKLCTIHRTSLTEKYSLAHKRESTIWKSITRTAIKHNVPQKLSVSSSSMNSSDSEEVPKDEKSCQHWTAPYTLCPYKSEFPRPVDVTSLSDCQQK